jgi:protein tyrosine phosphatase (PTP) superfamily phosphohydrolase (DUF442 family)
MKESTLKQLGIPAMRSQGADVWTSGQPDAAQLRAARDAGLRTVVSLCPAGECGWDEKATAESLGLRHATVSIGAACDLSEEASRRLHALLETCEKPVLVHCGSSNRVGALFALKAHFVDGHAPETALAHGRAAGLQGLETAVRSRLNQTGVQT